MHTITTILPTYRRPHLLERAIQSVLNQTYKNLEIQVYDNNSCDDTEKVVRALADKDERVRYFCQKSNIGAFENFQFGLRRVQTAFFSFLSDDDVLLPGFYEEAVRQLQGMPTCGFACTQVIRIDARGRITGRPDSLPVGVFEPPKGFKTLIDNHIPTWTGILFRTEVRDTIGILNQATGYAADQDFTLRAAARFSFCSLPIPGAIFSLDTAAAYRHANRHLIDLRHDIDNWCQSVRSDYGVSRDLAELATKKIRHRYRYQLYRAATQWALESDFPAVEKACLILAELGETKLSKLKLLANTTRYVPPFRWVLLARDRIRNTSAYKKFKATKRAAKYGELIKYENSYRQFE
ncbi:MAG: hypothetical protein OJF62_002295 [Pseudolabrys sp.]|jgi:glycosyltransferase involved in cell wall biosynthesis|nr:hypothetical protein [Pseudolabrys sp.]